MGILEGKKILVTGVLTEASIAFSVAKLAQEQGAEVILSSFGRMLPITTKISERLPKPAPVIELDATSEDDLAALSDELKNTLIRSMASCTQSLLPHRLLWVEISRNPMVGCFYRS
jgi:meromycolic acid enoyl-[acyl-carrier-protein] reductase